MKLLGVDASKHVAPAQTGTRRPPPRETESRWVFACAGTTVSGFSCMPHIAVPQ